MTHATETITFDAGSAKLTISTQDLLRAWLAQQLSIDLVQDEAVCALPTFGMPALNNGEHYAGVILDATGRPTHHVILLPDEAEDINWEDAGAWAAKVGGSLPTRREQALFFANAKNQFAEDFYWSCEQHTALSAYAWSQLFYDGYQDYDRTSYKARARAVRRLPIQ